MTVVGLLLPASQENGAKLTVSQQGPFDLMASCSSSLVCGSSALFWTPSVLVATAGICKAHPDGFEVTLVL
jgi:hypothetical protein